METFAYLQTAVDFEDSNSAAELRSLNELKLPVPHTVMVGAIAVGVAAATLGHAEEAQALLRPGNQGPGVTRLQATLPVANDGIYGPRTENAVRAFQRRAGLAVDGIAGPRTLAALGLPTNLGPGGGGGGTTPISGSAVVTGGVVRIRSAPNGAIVGRVTRGTRVSLTGRQSYAGGYTWAELASGNWIAREFLSASMGGDRPIAGGATITGNGVRIRTSPGGSVVGALYRGDRVSLTGRESFSDGRTWSQLASGNWVAKQYIRY